MLATLYNACGGVIYLTREGTELVAAHRVELFRDRLFDMIGHKPGFPSHLFSLIQISLSFETQTSWGAILLPSTTEEHQAVLQAHFCLDIDCNINPVEKNAEPDVNHENEA